MTVSRDEIHAGKINSVAIIGGGASGAISLDSLIQEQRFEKVKLFERRDRPGGIWVLDKNPDELDVKPGVNQDKLDPAVGEPLEPQTEGVLKKASKQQRYEQTASYKGLRTNIPESLMTFSDDKHWGEEEGERVEDHYVRGEAIQRYIDRYINRHRENVVFNTTVEHVTKDYTKDNAPFVLTLRTQTDLKDEDGDYLDRWWTEEFDAVVVAIGHYHVPFIPDVPGLDDVYREFPGLIKHSKIFRDAEKELKGKTAIVIGTRSSGADIVMLGNQHAKKIYHSQRARGQKLMRRFDSDVVELKPMITCYEVTPEKDVLVHFQNGTVVKNPDIVFYATGFRYSYPFLRQNYGSHFTTGNVIPDLYMHTFFNKDPLLTFVGVPTDAISFRAFEYQAVLVSRFLSGKCSLPPYQDQVRWCLERFSQKGNTRAYHTIDWGKKFDYLDSLAVMGGGYERIGSHGREFPRFSEEDKALHTILQEKLKAFFCVDESEISGVSSV